MTFPTKRGLRVVVAVDSEQRRAAELTAFVGLDPDESWDEGSEYRLGSRTARHKFSRWSIEESAGDDDDWDAVVDRIIARLAPAQARIHNLPSNVAVALWLFLTEDNGVFNFGLEKRHVEFLASIRCEINLSVVVIPDQRPRGLEKEQGV